MIILVDTNVILDVLLERSPFVASSSEIMGRVESGTVSGLLCATTVTTIHYLACKSIGKKRGHEAINKLLQIYQIAPVNQKILMFALASSFSDYEDSVLHASAIQAGAEAIITRNAKDFSHSDIPVFTPDELLLRL
ncbi:PIN domain-containing protein [Endozoicomonas sp. 8E]|uniref:PIN domain-containing protein n=1 Tax=Endozoicomonas sp. 8E TaxID=3035692 RepID=UPI00293948B3|nr:PIN domain-containing protein [Endozoicomonas sp. 8E]WOG27753.1 PIN domain-containing protein [Endozoicomonas sp. 8E]